MKSTAQCYNELRTYVAEVPLVDCHDHTSACGPNYTDATQLICSSYFESDLVSAGSIADVDFVKDSDKSLDERWPVLKSLWDRTCHTGYAEVTRRVLKEFYDEGEVTLEALKRIQTKLINYEDPALFEATLEKAGIKVRLLDVFVTQEILDGTLPPSPRGRFVISLPEYHAVNSSESVQNISKIAGMTVSTIDEYMEACKTIFTRMKDAGAVAFKDQSAYSRAIDYGNPTKAEAEAVFNYFMEDPRRKVGYPDGIKPLDDYLFHAFMRMARDLELPVQIHTGHMAGIYNDIVKTNAIGLTQVLELHKDVKFDLFHANWPYMGELLFLGKNYPNVSLDFCWANIIDPLYSREMFKRAISSVPHGKIHGYGSDYLGYPDRAWAHADIARDNIAAALADLVEIDWFSFDDARQVAKMWMFDNPNEFFRLGL